MVQVNKWRTSRGVLIYANDPLNNKLVKEYYVDRVTLKTPHEDLRQMDVQTGENYPVYLIDEKYGGRALDYRAANNVHGICMLICDAFRDKRTRN